MELVDFSAGFPSAQQIKSAGFGGVIGYFSDARASWMKAKPVTRAAYEEYSAAGLEMVCNYQFGKGGTADWREGFAGGQRHAERMLALMAIAGVSLDDEPVLYGPVDDNPTASEYIQYVRPFFKGWESVVGHWYAGAYCNTRTIDWLADDGLCAFYWQHAWDGINRPALQKINPKAHIIQYEIDAASVGGIGADRNKTLKGDFGQVSRFRAIWRDNQTQLLGP